jgi:hypothetical protein
MIPEIIEDKEYLYRGVVPQNWDSWIIRSIPTQFPAKYPEFRK